MSSPIRRSAPARKTPLAPGKPLKRGALSGRKVVAEMMPPLAATKTPRRETGFTYAQRMAVRKRAGNGDIDDAACEACGRWLGRYGGQVHHRCNRGTGGSRTRNRLSNAALVCGTPYDLCHGKCTALDEEMRAEGFVLNSGQDPLMHPILHHGRNGGVTAWLTDAGTYIFEAPAGAR